MFKNKAMALIVSILLMLTVTIGGSLAYLIATSDAVTNTFNPSHVTTAVEETFDNNVKKDVKIKNTGDTTAYIRAAVVVTWQKYNEETDKYDVYGQLPVLNSDYTMELGLGNGWVPGSDGFYYWPNTVAPGMTTGDLIERAELTENAVVPEGYFFCIEILGSGIQADGVDKDGKSPIELAWGTKAAQIVGLIEEG